MRTGKLAWPFSVCRMSRRLGSLTQSREASLRAAFVSRGQARGIKRAAKTECFQDSRAAFGICAPNGRAYSKIAVVSLPTPNW